MPLYFLPLKKAVITVVLILLLDQFLKFYIKLNFHLNESVTLLPGIIDLHFVENEGMAFGWKLPGGAGKIGLTIFRMLAAGLIGFYLFRLIKEKAKTGLVICVALILAGALGNILDSVFYGLIFSSSPEHSALVATLFPESGGYAPALMGRVVDMLHFTATWPSWVPFVSENQLIFPPVFNIADSAISVGVIIIVIRQKAFFGKSKKTKEVVEETPTAEPSVDSEA